MIRLRIAGEIPSYETRRTKTARKKIRTAPVGNDSGFLLLARLNPALTKDTKAAGLRSALRYLRETYFRRSHTTSLVISSPPCIMGGVRRVRRSPSSFT